MPVKPISLSSMPPPRAHLLIVDDEPDLRTLYELTLLREGYRVDAAGDLAQARQLLREQQFEVVITDMRLPDGLGLELLHEMVSQQRAERCIVITAHGSADNAVKALKAGAFDYLTKPVDLKQFRSVVASAVAGAPTALTGAGSGIRRDSEKKGLNALCTASTELPETSHLALTALDRLVGESTAMLLVKQRIAKVAASMAPVLIRGESGTGKELVARAIHACSHRAQGPFVAVNCSAIPEHLVEAEFFGARKGAYTGANQDRQGYFHAAQGGTLFLDEIGDLPLAMQSKLLRAIQERVVRPLGSTQEDSVDVRILSATHKDLASEVADSRFRQDLFYRINVIEIKVPPLRERMEDLPALCTALLTRICHESAVPVPQVDAKLLQRLRQYPFNGNVRELENLLHRAVTLSETGELHLDEAPDSYVMVPDSLQDYLDAQERAILVRVLQETHFNRSAAASRLGLSLRQMRYRIARLNIALPQNDDSAPEHETEDF